MSEVKFIRKKYNASLETWERELNKEGRNGWKVIQVFTAPNGEFTALLRRDS